MRFHYAPQWAKPVLLRMVEKGILEQDTAGNYHLKPVPKKETEGKQWASPQLAELFQRRGKQFDHVISLDYEDAYYDKL